MGFCSCMNKLFLTLLNFAIFAIGAAIVVLASIVIHKSSEYGQLLLEGMLTLPIWTLFLGIVITMIGFFGCCGALKENKCMLFTYAFVVLILLLAEIALGVLVAVFPRQAEGHLKDGLSQVFQKYNEDDPALTKAIDALQHDLKCCGVNGPQDWNSIFNTQIPPSCCIDPSNCDPNSFAPSSSVYREGCFEAIIDDVKGVAVALGVACIILVIVQVLCIVIACGLGRKRTEYV